MTTESISLIFGTILLIALMLFRAEKLSMWPVTTGIFILGIVTAQLGLDSLLDYLRLDRRTQFLKVFNHLQYRERQEESIQPRVLLVGSSRTARNVDGELLQSLLQQRLMSVRVGQLSSPGSYTFEQDYYLERFLAESRYPPDYVFLELGSEFRGAIDAANRFKNDPVAFHDLRRSLDILKGQVDGWRVKESVITVGHLLGHYLNLGVVRFLTPVGEEQRPGFLPENLPEDAPSVSEVDSQLSADVEAKDVAQSLVDYRVTQRERLLGLSVQNVVFVVYPIAAAETRARVEKLCASIAPCISLNDAETLARLNGPYWTDLNHLSHEGALILTRILSDRISALEVKHGS